MRKNKRLITNCKTNRDKHYISSRNTSKKITQMLNNRNNSKEEKKKLRGYAKIYATIREFEFELEKQLERDSWLAQDNKLTQTEEYLLNLPKEDYNDNDIFDPTYYDETYYNEWNYEDSF